MGLWSWILGKQDEPRECMYGDLPGTSDNCTVVVLPGEGWRRNGLVFCSEEHAARDQEEQVF